VATTWTKKEEPNAQENMFWGYLNAAWACDDAAEGNLEQEEEYDQEKCKWDAVECRKMCLKIINSLIVDTKNEEEKETLVGIKADLLRRTGQFDALVVEFENKVFKNPRVADVVKFEIDRAKERDTKRYSMDHIKQ
jgi:hypothetical protein